MTRPEHFEHVTLYYYDHPEEFSIGAFSAPVDRSGERLTVDTEEGLAKLARIVARMDRPHYEYSYEQILALDAE
jgi:spore coat polysaccharide biosynthesis protein SpsF (cytidylyltransferase family)